MAERMNGATLDSGYPLQEESHGKTYVERLVSYSGDGRFMLICERSFINRSVWNICDTSVSNRIHERYIQSDFAGLQELRRGWCERHNCVFSPVRDNA